MALRVNGGDYNMPTLAGIVADLTFGHDLPFDLYAYGLGRERDTIYVDDTLPQEFLVHGVPFLRSKGISVTIGLPTAPNIRPAVGLPRSMRSDENIRMCAKVCSFILFFIHDTFLVPENKADLELMYNDVENEFEDEFEDDDPLDF